LNKVDIEHDIMTYLKLFSYIFRSSGQITANKAGEDCIKILIEDILKEKVVFGTSTKLPKQEISVMPFLTC
jgi:hypothetical protein